MEAVKPSPMIGSLKWLLDIVWYLLWALLTVTAVGFLGATLVYLAQLFGWIPESAVNSLRRVIDLVIMLPLVVVEILALMMIVFGYLGTALILLLVSTKQLFSHS